MSDQNTSGKQEAFAAYWRANVRLVLQLLAIWFLVSFGAGILFKDALDAFHLFGYPVGFWFAQQGSIYVFVALIFIYSRKISKIERDLGLKDDGEGEQP